MEKYREVISAYSNKLEIKEEGKNIKGEKTSDGNYPIKIEPKKEIGDERVLINSAVKRGKIGEQKCYPNI